MPRQPTTATVVDALLACCIAGSFCVGLKKAERRFHPSASRTIAEHQDADAGTATFTVSSLGALTPEKPLLRTHAQPVFPVGA
jgi:hypothetical protein